MTTIFKEENQQITSYKHEHIESEIIRIYLEQINKNVNDIKNSFLLSLITEPIHSLRESLLSLKKNWTLKDIEKLFYSLISNEEVDNNGIIFTPNYIVDYIIKETLNGKYNGQTICDPSCGCGAFLIRNVENIIQENPSIDVIELIENKIYGADILEENVRRTKILLSLLAIELGGDCKDINFKIICTDSTNPDLLLKFNDPSIENGFDIVVGNPPYLKVQDLEPTKRKQLKENFKTATSGSINLYFAFVELGVTILNKEGRLGYIIPNYFLKMEAAKPLRSFLLENTLISKIIDFKDSKLFEDAQTYSAIVILDRTTKEKFAYNIISKLVKKDLSNVNESLKSLYYKDTDPETINLLTENEKLNIHNIENAGAKLNISTGIATQKDPLYIIGLKKNESIDENGEFYLKEFNGKLFPIEKDITVSLIKGGTNIDHEKGCVKKKLKVIYPYQKNSNGDIKVIPEDVILNSYPNTYKYFEAIKEELGKRNKGKPSVNIWYEYGRSQALDRFGKKILFPTNSDKPKFTLFNEEALFNNGYAIYGIDSKNILKTSVLSLSTLCKILNSVVMDYYIKLTSYMISGGYYCYQKKYIKNFSIPIFSDDEITFLDNCNEKESIDKFLIEKYNLKL